jgi:transposase
MPRGKPNKQYNGEFKQKAVEDMRGNGLSQCEVAKKYGITRSMIQRWERIYLEAGPQGLFIERRGRANNISGTQKGRKPKLDNKVEEDLIAENQRLRAEVDYLKKLNALVLEEERRSKRRK